MLAVASSIIRILASATSARAKAKQADVRHDDRLLDPVRRGVCHNPAVEPQ